MCVWVYMCVCVYIYIYLCVCVYVYIYICVCVLSNATLFPVLYIILPTLTDCAKATFYASTRPSVAPPSFSITSTLSH